MKRFFITLFIVLAVLFGILLGFPYLFKDRLVQFARDQINKNIDAKVDFSGISLSLISQFPQLTFTLKDLVVINHEPFEGDTLITLDKFSLGLDLWSVIRGQNIEINSIILNKPVVHILIDENGMANYDIFPETEENPASGDETSSAYRISLKSLNIRNGKVKYTDKTTGMAVTANPLDYALSGDFSETRFDMDMLLNAAGLTVIYGGIPYLNNANLKFDALIDADTEKNKYTFKDNQLAVNALRLMFDGWIRLAGEDIESDLTFRTGEGAFKEIVSLLPAAYTNDFKDLKSSGTLELDGYMKGLYNASTLPAFRLNLNIKDGNFQFPDLPEAVEDVNIYATVLHPQGTADLTEIMVKKFTANLGGDPIDLKLFLKTPESDPQFDMSVKASVDLKKVPKYYPLEDVDKLTGKLDASINARGRLSDIESERYDRVSVAGDVTLDDLVYRDPTLAAPVRVSKMSLSFNPRNVLLKEFTAKAGKSDVSASGSLINFFGWFFSDEPLKGALNLSSRQLDLNEWYAPEEENADEAEPVEASVIEIPGNIDFLLSTQIDRLIFESYELKNITGNVQVKDRALSLKQLRAVVFDGIVNIRGDYRTKTTDKPEVDFTYNIKQIDIQQLAKNSPAANKLMPVIRFINGRFNSDMQMKTLLMEDMTPDWQTLLANGKVELTRANIGNFKPLEKIADQLKIPRLKQIEVKDIWTVFEVKNGRVFIEPFQFKQGNITFLVEGSHGLDQSMQYTIHADIPRSELRGADALVNNLIASSPLKGMASMPDVLRFKINLTGMIDDPRVSISLGDMQSGKSLADQAKESLEQRLREEKDKLKEEAVQQAKEEAEKLKQEAERKKQEAEQKAREEAERLRQEAEQKKQEAAEKAREEAEKVKEEAKDKIKNIFGPK